MTADPLKLAGSARRVFIVGASGSGKSTLARSLGEQLSVPVHDLDLVYREGGGNGLARPASQVREELARIAGAPTWVAEGVHLDGIDVLLERAELIIWLDDSSWLRNSRRVVRRFAKDAWATARRQRRIRDFFRFRDYWRHMRELAGSVPTARRYEAEGITALEERLRPYASKVVRGETGSDSFVFVTR